MPINNPPQNQQILQSQYLNQQLFTDYYSPNLKNQQELSYNQQFIQKAIQPQITSSCITNNTPIHQQPQFLQFDNSQLHIQQHRHQYQVNNQQQLTNSSQSYSYPFSTSISLQQPSLISSSQIITNSNYDPNQYQQKQQYYNTLQLSDSHSNSNYISSQQLVQKAQQQMQQLIQQNQLLFQVAQSPQIEFQNPLNQTSLSSSQQQTQINQQYQFQDKQQQQIQNQQQQLLLQQKLQTQSNLFIQTPNQELYPIHAILNSERKPIIIQNGERNYKCLSDDKLNQNQVQQNELINETLQNNGIEIIQKNENKQLNSNNDKIEEQDLNSNLSQKNSQQFQTFQMFLQQNQKQIQQELSERNQLTKQQYLQQQQTSTSLNFSPIFYSQFSTDSSSSNQLQQQWQQFNQQQLLLNETKSDQSIQLSDSFSQSKSDSHSNFQPYLNLAPDNKYNSQSINFESQKFSPVESILDSGNAQFSDQYKLTLPQISQQTQNEQLQTIQIKSQQSEHVHKHKHVHQHKHSQISQQQQQIQNINKNIDDQIHQQKIEKMMQKQQIVSADSKVVALRYNDEDEKMKNKQIKLQLNNNKRNKIGIKKGKINKIQKYSYNDKFKYSQNTSISSLNQNKIHQLQNLQTKINQRSSKIKKTQPIIFIQISTSPQKFQQLLVPPSSQQYQQKQHHLNNNVNYKQQNQNKIKSHQPKTNQKRKIYKLNRSNNKEHFQPYSFDQSIMSQQSIKSTPSYASSQSQSSSSQTHSLSSTISQQQSSYQSQQYLSQSSSQLMSQTISISFQSPPESTKVSIQNQSISSYSSQSKHSHSSSKSPEHSISPFNSSLNHLHSCSQPVSQPNQKDYTQHDGVSHNSNYVDQKKHHKNNLNSTNDRIKQFNNITQQSSSQQKQQTPSITLYPQLNQQRIDSQQRNQNNNQNINSKISQTFANEDISKLQNIPTVSEISTISNFLGEFKSNLFPQKLYTQPSNLNQSDINKNKLSCNANSLQLQTNQQQILNIKNGQNKSNQINQLNSKSINDNENNNVNDDKQSLTPPSSPDLDQQTNFQQQK